MTEAVIRYADSESNEDYERAADNLRKAMHAYIDHVIAVRRGSAGGKARAKAMTPEERTAAGRRAINERWKKARIRSGYVSEPVHPPPETKD